MTPVTACDKCGQPIKAEWPHCPFCGARQSGASGELLAPEVSRGLGATERGTDPVRPPLPDPEYDHWQSPGTFFLLEADDDLREAYFESLPDESESEPNQILINELACELEVKAKVIIDYLPEIGLEEKKTHSSSIDLAAAEKVRKHFCELADAEAAAEAAAAAEKAAKEANQLGGMISSVGPYKLDSGSPSFLKKAKRIGYWLLGLAFFALLIALGMTFVYGMVWVSARLYPVVELLSILGLIALVLNLFPSAIFKSSRRYCGKGVVIVSYIWGVALWMYATLVLYSLWGGVGMFLGFALLGVGSVPLACVALLFAGKWSMVAEMVLWTVIVFGTRALGRWIFSEGTNVSQSEEAMKWPFKKKSSASPAQTLIALTDEEQAECQAFIRSLSGGDEGTLYIKKESMEEVQRYLVAQCLMGRAERFAIFASSPGHEEEYTQKACEAAAKACRIYPLSVNFYDFGCTLQRLGKYEDAKVMFAEFLRRHETLPPSPLDEGVLSQRDVSSAVVHARNEISK